MNNKERQQKLRDARKEAWLVSPSPQQIKQARTEAGLTQQACADLVYKTPRAWQHYEQGTRAMPRSAWELFKHKIGDMK